MTSVNMNRGAARNSLLFCVVFAAASWRNNAEAFVIPYSQTPLASKARSIFSRHHVVLQRNIRRVDRTNGGKSAAPNIRLMSSTVEDVPNLSEKSNKEESLVTSLVSCTQELPADDNRHNEMNSTISSIANLAITAQEHAAFLPSMGMDEEEAKIKQQQLSAVQLLASAPLQEDGIPPKPVFSDAQGVTSSTNDPQASVVDVNQVSLDSRENTSHIPSAADLIMAAEEGFILPTNVLNNDFPLMEEGKLTQNNQRETGQGVSVDLSPTVASPVEEKDAGSTTVVPLEDSETIASPGLLKILQFALPAIGVWLCGPILSLIDTASVGLLAGTAHQAALSPAVAITDYGALLMAFMYTGTTNLIASAKETDKHDATKKKTARTLIAAMQLSLVVGSVLGVGLLGGGKFLLKGIIGNDTVDPLVFRTALNYIRIRALGMPAAALIGSAQAACLGLQDIKSPLYVLLAAAVVNFVGDLVLVGKASPWIGGAAGAAWATVFSQYAAMGLFTLWLAMKPGKTKEDEEKPKFDVRADDAGGEAFGQLPKFSAPDAERPKPVINLTKAILDKTSNPLKQRFSSDKSEATLPGLKISPFKSSGNFRVQEVMLSAAGKLRRLTLSARLKQLRGNGHRSEASADTFSTRGFLHGRLRFRNLVSLPPKATAREFWPYVLPVTTTSAGRVSAYVAMSHVVSSSLGTMAMAAQQVIISIFYCLCPVADALNLTAQSLIPSLFEKKKSKERAMALRRAAIDFFAAGGLFGGFLVGAVACIPMIARLFTSDLSVVAQVNSVVPLLALSFVVHGAICAMEGVMLGQRDLGFLGKAYGFYFAAVPLVMLRIKRNVLKGLGSTTNLSSVWKVFAGYQLVRFVMFVSRVYCLTRRTNREAADVSRGTIRVLDDTRVGEPGKSLTEVDGVPLEPPPVPKEIITSSST